MRRIPFISLFAACIAAAILSGCGTMPVPPTFALDLRPAQVPVMLSPVAARSAGRVISADVVSSLTQISSSTAIGGTVVSSTFSSAYESAYFLGSKVLGMIAARDQWLLLDGLSFTLKKSFSPGISRKDCTASFQAHAFTGAPK